MTNEVKKDENVTVVRIVVTIIVVLAIVAMIGLLGFCAGGKPNTVVIERSSAEAISEVVVKTDSQYNSPFLQTQEEVERNSVLYMEFLSGQ